MNTSDFLALLRALTHISSPQLERAQQHIKHHFASKTKAGNKPVNTRNRFSGLNNVCRRSVGVHSLVIIDV